MGVFSHAFFIIFEYRISMLVLGIESTCDEMAIALVREGKEILCNVIASQSQFHRQFNGVFPEMAARQHVDLFIPTLESALKEANVSKESIDLIAVAKGPGLIGSLLIGINGAKALSLAWNVPLIGVNHVEAHLYAAMLSNPIDAFPALGVVVSGGHTFLVRITAIGSYELIGTTLDDAVGEAFDKVARLLDLPYPGGPEIENLAKEGDPKRFPFKAGKIKNHPWDFSFSGLKTSVLYAVKGQNGGKNGISVISDIDKKDIAASFQETALGDIADKALAAASAFGCRALYFGGGVTQNKRLRQIIENRSTLPVYWPAKGLSLDNGAMIAGLGFHQYKGTSELLSLEPMPNLSLSPDSAPLKASQQAFAAQPSL